MLGERICYTRSRVLFGAEFISTVCVQIVRHDRTMEQIVFPIPEICEYITAETKFRVYNTAERDDQGSKVSDFFERHEDMFSEMKWQKKLRGNIGILTLNTKLNTSNPVQALRKRFDIVPKRSVSS